MVTKFLTGILQNYRPDIRRLDIRYKPIFGTVYIFVGQFTYVWDNLQIYGTIYIFVVGEGLDDVRERRVQDGGGYRGW